MISVSLINLVITVRVPTKNCQEKTLHTPPPCRQYQQKIDKYQQKIDKYQQKIDKKSPPPHPPQTIPTENWQEKTLPTPFLWTGENSTQYLTKLPFRLVHSHFTQRHWKIDWIYLYGACFLFCSLKVIVVGFFFNLTVAHIHCGVAALCFVEWPWPTLMKGRVSCIQTENLVINTDKYSYWNLWFC